MNKERQGQAGCVQEFSSLYDGRRELAMQVEPGAAPVPRLSEGLQVCRHLGWRSCFG